MKKFLFMLGNLGFFASVFAQATFPVNGVADKREGCYAFTNATIIKDVQNTLKNATLLIRDGKIVAVGNSVSLPKDAVVIDCKDKFIYPSFIDIYSDYGTPTTPPRQGGFNSAQQAQLNTNTKGAYGWNQAIKSEANAFEVFATDDAKAKALRDLGFGTVLTHVKDGIARGTGSLVTLANEKENLVILKDRASTHYSFSKGSSTQTYPGSLMGCIALLRQSYLDAQWYKNKPKSEGLNLSLQAGTKTKAYPRFLKQMISGTTSGPIGWAMSLACST